MSPEEEALQVRYLLNRIGQLTRHIDRLVNEQARSWIVLHPDTYHAIQRCVTHPTYDYLGVDRSPTLVGIPIAADPLIPRWDYRLIFAPHNDTERTEP